MANLGGTFDATQVAPSQAFEVLPPGKYKVQVTDSDMRPTKDGNGQYLWLEMEILDGEFHGRKIWDRLNLVNPNQQAVEIAQRSLSALCHATGKLHVTDSEALHFIPVIATVRVRPAKGDFDASNEIRGYEPAGNGAVTQMKPATTSAASAATPSSAPWKRKSA